MDFEYDPLKSESNKIKHAIDFEEAQELWEDLNVLEVPSAYAGEERYLVIGKINDIGWTAIVTRREEVTRIISVRRSRVNEAQSYDHCKRTR